MPKYDWVRNSIDASCRNTALCEYFIELIRDNNLQQMVDVPTRGKNTPDLYLTDRPTLVVTITCLLAPG